MRALGGRPACPWLTREPTAIGPAVLFLPSAIAGREKRHRVGGAAVLPSCPLCFEQPFLLKHARGARGRVPHRLGLVARRGEVDVCRLPVSCLPAVRLTRLPSFRLPAVRGGKTGQGILGTAFVPLPPLRPRQLVLPKHARRTCDLVPSELGASWGEDDVRRLPVVRRPPGRTIRIVSFRLPLRGAVPVRERGLCRGGS